MAALSSTAALAAVIGLPAPSTLQVASVKLTASVFFEGNLGRIPLWRLQMRASSSVSGSSALRAPTGRPSTFSSVFLFLSLPIGEGLGFRFKVYVLWCFDGFERGL